MSFLYKIYILQKEMELRTGLQNNINEFNHLTYGMTIFTFPLPTNYRDIQMSGEIRENDNMQLTGLVQQKIYCTLEKSIEYFKSFFSPINTALSLQKRNENLEMMKFQNSDEEPDDVYNRRKKKVFELMTKQEDQIQIIFEIRKQSQERFNAIIEFLKFFCLIKQKLQGYKNDYYSNKTFCAIKNASIEQLVKATKIIQKMFDNVMRYPLIYEDEGILECKQKELNARMVEFLIIPRFLISKEKINRLSRDEELQKNFEFLVIHQCLGHYNNEANKKMPEEKQMKLVRELLSKKTGREKFKKICSINHGNKFFKIHGNVYYSLYSQSLNYLRFLQSSLKKGKKFDMIKKDLEKIPIQAQQTVGGNSSLTENQSSSNIYSFKSFGECLNNMQNEKDQEDLLNERPQSLESLDKSSMHKGKVKKLMSLPTPDESNSEPKCENRTFQVKKSMTMQQKMTQNIILVPPPSKSKEV